jgi:single-strand DNA-binding protein
MLNRVMLIGNLTRDVEMRYLPSGDGIASFGMATSRRWKDKQGQRQEESEFHNITIFGGLAKVCGDYLKKGSKVYVEGRIKAEKWEKDGQQHSRVVIIGENMHMLDSKGNTDNRPQSGTVANKPAPIAASYDDFDDIDF